MKIKLWKPTFVIATSLVVGIVLGVQFHSQIKSLNFSQYFRVQNKQSAFMEEVFETVLANYWDNINEAQLAEIFQKSIEKKLNKETRTISSKKELLAEIDQLTARMKSEEKNSFTKEVSALVLANLQPFGRSGLFTAQDEQNLKNTVENINPEKNLYHDLGLEQGANQQQIEEAYKKKFQEFSQDQSPQSQQQLEKISYAKDVLTNQDQKKRYDQTKVEPTIFTKDLDGVIYLRFLKFSPTTYEEFAQVSKKLETKHYRSIIIDFRDNIGGAIDTVPFFLGNFLGPNQYVVEFYQQGQTKPFKTTSQKLPGIAKIKQKVVLIDGKTQSSAELLVSGLKKYNQAVLVGEKTKGWGTIERVFPLKAQLDENEKYSIFLVHHISLREDGQPIEGRGVEPHVNIGVQYWEGEFRNFIRDGNLEAKIKLIMSDKPLGS